MNIFLVDDSPAIRARLADMLAEIPGTTLVGEAADAYSAIRDILVLRPDLVLLDLSLAAGTSGFDVLRGVCREAPGIDFYMLTNFDADPYRQIAERLGARDFFDKSRQIGQVRQLIAQRAAATHH